MFITVFFYFVVAGGSIGFGMSAGAVCAAPGGGVGVGTGPTEHAASPAQHFDAQSGHHQRNT